MIRATTYLPAHFVHIAFNSIESRVLILVVWYGNNNFMTTINAGNGVLAAVICIMVMI